LAAPLVCVRAPLCLPFPLPQSSTLFFFLSLTRQLSWPCCGPSSRVPCLVSLGRNAHASSFKTVELPCRGSWAGIRHQHRLRDPDGTPGRGPSRLRAPNLRHLIGTPLLLLYFFFPSTYCTPAAMLSCFSPQRVLALHIPAFHDERGT
jgi:hypothetical protein